MTFQFAKIPTSYLSFQPYQKAPPTAGLLLTELVRLATWRRKTYYTSVASLAEHIDRSERSVQRALRYLEKHHFIEQWRRARLPGGEVVSYAPGEAVVGWEIESEFHLVMPDEVLRRWEAEQAEENSPDPEQVSLPLDPPLTMPPSIASPPQQRLPGMDNSSDQGGAAAGPTAPPASPPSDSGAATRSDRTALKELLREALHNAIVAQPDGNWPTRCRETDPVLVGIADNVLRQQRDAGRYHGPRRRRWVIQTLRELGEELVEASSASATPGALLSPEGHPLPPTTTDAAQQPLGLDCEASGPVVSGSSSTTSPPGSRPPSLPHTTAHQDPPAQASCDNRADRVQSAEMDPSMTVTGSGESGERGGLASLPPGAHLSARLATVPEEHSPPPPAAARTVPAPTPDSPLPLLRTQLLGSYALALLEGEGRGLSAPSCGIVVRGGDCPGPAPLPDPGGGPPGDEEDDPWSALLDDLEP